MKPHYRSRPNQAPAPRTDPTSWKDRAACRDSELDFLDSDGQGLHGHTRKVYEMRLVCQACPVIDDCFEYANTKVLLPVEKGGTTKASYWDVVGMFAGLTPGERDDLRSNRRKYLRGLNHREVLAKKIRQWETRRGAA